MLIIKLFAHPPCNLNATLSDLFVSLDLEVVDLHDVETLRKFASFGEAARLVVALEALHKLLFRYFVDLDVLFINIGTAKVIMVTTIA